MRPIYEECKEEYNDTYNHFIQNTSPSYHNHIQIQSVIHIYPRYKEKMNESLIEFLKISGKYDYNNDFVKQTLEIFE